jgi:hypothetical protein
MTDLHRCLLTLLGYAALSFNSAAATAQQHASTRGMIPILILAPSDANDEHQQEITITRRPGDGGYVIVLPPGTASTKNIRRAVRMVSELLDRDGPSVRDDSVFRIPATTAAPQVEPAAGSRVLARLMASVPRDMHGVRRAHFAYIYMPDRMSQALTKASGEQRGVPR